MLSRPLTRSPAVVLALVTLAACKDAGSGGSARVLEFQGEHPFLSGLDVDTGWQPDASDVAVRATTGASGRVVVSARATADGETLSPVAGSGAVVVEGALAFEVSARIDTMGIAYEGVVGSFDYGLEPTTQAFEPFALQEAVIVSTTLPAKELASVPIPSLPGASLVMSVIGGELTTSFEGTCAQAHGGAAQYVGTLSMRGTIACAASVEVDVPIIGVQTFGPFEFDIQVPELASEIDLGTLSLADGGPSDATGICDGGGTTAGGGESASAGDDLADTAGSTDDDSASEGGTFFPSDDSSGGSSSGDDPRYPPGPDCPAGYEYAWFGGPTEPNAVCLPPCNRNGCPLPEEGYATPVCQYIPSGEDVATHCKLKCDPSIGAFCPGEMVCVSDGHCSWPL